MNLQRALKLYPVVLAVAALSKDWSRRVGAIAFGPEGEIRSTGYNGLPRGIDETPHERHVKPAKLRWYIHAEENVIAQAARSGASLRGCSLIVSELHPCSKCAGLAVQAGIIQIFSPPPLLSDPTWGADALIAQQILLEAKVEQFLLDPETLKSITEGAHNGRQG